MQCLVRAVPHRLCPQTSSPVLLILLVESRAEVEPADRHDEREFHF